MCCSVDVNKRGREEMQSEEELHTQQAASAYRSNIHQHACGTHDRDAKSSHQRSRIAQRSSRQVCRIFLDFSSLSATPIKTQQEAGRSAEIGWGGGKPVRQVGRQRLTDTQTQAHRHRHTDTGTQTHAQVHKQTHTDTDTQTHTDTHTNTHLLGSIKEIAVEGFCLTNTAAKCQEKAACANTEQQKRWAKSHQRVFLVDSTQEPLHGAPTTITITAVFSARSRLLLLLLFAPCFARLLHHPSHQKTKTN